MLRLYVILFFSFTCGGFEVRGTKVQPLASSIYQLCVLGQVTLSNP